MKNDIKQIPRRSRTHEITGAIQPIRNYSRSTVSLDLGRLIVSYRRRSLILITCMTRRSRFSLLSMRELFIKISQLKIAVL